MEPRLKTAIWVAGYIRQCGVRGLPSYVVKRGDNESGAVIVKINLLNGRARLLAARVAPAGGRDWAPVLADDPSAEEAVDGYIATARIRDPDLWVIEIENPSGEDFLKGL